ncbi:hypothetical protein ACH5RR_029092 [Cinchona calisaya]|uniref:Uncharacterized protein n=1 Tax=Cinchona calisaya TaxID=153742 RepID=A0ABD2YQM9_9GENT
MEGQGLMISSSLNNKLQVPEEESGWTQYLEDFSTDQREDSCSYSLNGSPSLVSDAASPNKKEIIAYSSFSGQQQFPKRLNIVKKQRTKKYSCDDLEDTASSPVNSPKVGSLKPVDTTNQRRTNESISNCLGKEGSPDGVMGLDERSSINYDGKNNDYINMDLKKRGLCLMPFSMVANYLG